MRVTLASDSGVKVMEMYVPIGEELIWIPDEYIRIQEEDDGPILDRVSVVLEKKKDETSDLSRG